MITMWVKPLPFRQILSGVKTLELRTLNHQTRKVRVGTIIIWNNHRGCKRRVTRVTEYQNVRAVLEHEDIARLAPHLVDKTPAEQIAAAREMFAPQAKLVIWEMTPQT